MNGFRQLGGEIRERPWLVVLTAAITTAILFPRVAAGSVGLVVVAGFVGIAAVQLWSRVPDGARSGVGSRRLAGWIAIALVASTAVYVFRFIVAHSGAWPDGDWGPQHVVLRSFVDHLQDGRLPYWSHLISTGDSLDVYPSFTYMIAAVLAIAGGWEERLPFVLILLGVIAHMLVAIGVTRLALRFLPPALAAVLGMLVVVDLASVTATIKTGMLHSAMSQAFSLFAVVAVVDALRRPRLTTSVAIWIWTALAAATHPVGLLSTIVAMIGLAAVAVLARDIPAPRALAAIAHLAIGTMLAAVTWLPLGERILLYGQHFADAPSDPARWVAGLIREANAYGSFALVVFVGYVGTVAGLWSRRAVPVFIAANVLVMSVAMVDAPYLAFDLAPSHFTARLGSLRFSLLMRPFVFLATGYMLCIVGAHIRTRWQGADRRSILVGSFIAGILVCAGTRFGCQSAYLQVADARIQARQGGRQPAALVAWAREQVAAMASDRWGRVLFVNGTAAHHHVTAVTGLAAYHHGPIPNVLMRERIEDLEPESLRRFNVRWIVATDPRDPLTLGDPATERLLDGYRVREVASWDGQFARVERGSGRAVVTRLDDDVVEVELRDTTQPALVALGTGYYPRWRARTADGRSVPVYGYPATTNGHNHVVAAWLSPGTTRFTPDGALPSDDDGRPLSILGLALAIAIICTWSQRRARCWVLRRFARARGFRMPHRWRFVAAVLAAVGLIAWGATASVAPVRDLQLGSGLRANAEVSVKHGDGTWHACDYASSVGEYQCGDGVVVSDGIAPILNDTQVLWPFTTPAIAIVPRDGSVHQARVQMSRRFAGRYWIGSTDQPVEISLSGMAPFMTDRSRVIELEDREYTIAITAPPQAVPEWVTMVREDTVLPGYMVPRPPETAPTR